MPVDPCPDYSCPGSSSGGVFYYQYYGAQGTTRYKIYANAMEGSTARIPGFNYTNDTTGGAGGLVQGSDSGAL